MLFTFLIQLLALILGIMKPQKQQSNSPPGGYKQLLKSDGLKGKRLGIVVNPFLVLLNRSTAASTFKDHLNVLR